MKELYRDKIRGSLMAGAAGDALGYAVEFISRSAILKRYGADGITTFALEESGKAIISDDTQMTLFTANGLLNAATTATPYIDAITDAYVDWYYTQSAWGNKRGTHCWLSDIDELYALRAPGNTCLSALKAIVANQTPSNNSYGCGGIMRVAPIALYGAAEHRMTIEEVVRLAGDAAEVTHKHPLGFLSAALFAAFIYRVMPLTPVEVTANSTALVEECLEVVDRVYQGKHQVDIDSLKHLTHRAIDLTTSDKSDAECIRHLGEGWVGDEAWAIALYCTLRHLDSVERAIIAAVNHDGDSDSTGSICGNVMGAIYGYKHIKERNIFCPTGHELEQTLELAEVILKVANELAE